MNRLVLILFCGLIIGGCATTAVKKEEQLRNIYQAYDARENLRGYSREDISRRFGQPDFIQTFSLDNPSREIWNYFELYAIMKVTFTSGVVETVDYD